MKHLFLTLLLATFSVIGAKAQADFLTFRGIDGNEQSLPAIGTRITFNDNGLIATNGSSVVQYDFDKIDLMFFSSTMTSIAAAPTSGTTAAIVNGYLTVTAPAATPVVLYNAEGRRVSTTARLPRGLYVVRVGNEAYKLMSE